MHNYFAGDINDNLSFKCGCFSPHFYNACVHDIKSVFEEHNSFPYKMHVFRKMQFVSHCYSMVSCQPILSHSVYEKKNQRYTSRMQWSGFLDIRDLGSLTTIKSQKL